MALPRITRWTHRSPEEAVSTALLESGIVVGYAGRPGGDGLCEDAALVIEMPGQACLLAVADGMGSGPRAADASATIIEALAARAASITDDGSSRIQVLDAIEEASATIRGWGVGAATTVMIVEVDPSTCRTYHVGDSEALVTGQRGRVKLRTISHSPVGYATASGLMPDSDAMVHEDRHLVDSMVGLPGMRVDLGERLGLAPRDTLVLATDGLFDNLDEREIVEQIRKGPLRKVGTRLLERTVERMQNAADGAPGKPDDLAFILYRPPGNPTQK